jgi:hypothetical protein
MNNNITEVNFLDARTKVRDLDDPELLAIEEIAVAGASKVCERLNAGLFTYPIPPLRDLPYGTKSIGSSRTGARYRSVKDKKPILIVASLAVYEDLVWYHVSFSRADKLPSYSDRAWVKKYWIGEDRWAVDVLPSKKLHVNIHPYCLHLWHCIERPDILPNFNVRGHV